MKIRAVQLVVAGGLFAGILTTGAVVAPPTDSNSYFASSLTRQMKSDSAVHLFDPKSLTKALPTVVYKYNGRNIRLSSLVATGQFSEPRKLQSTTNSEEPESATAPPWQRGAITFTVKTVVSSAGLKEVPHAGDSLQVETYFGPDVDVVKAEEDLTRLDTALVFLAGDGTAITPWTVADGGLLIGSVDPSGRLTMLAAEKRADGQFDLNDVLVDVSSLDQLLLAAKGPGSVVIVQ